MCGWEQENEARTGRVLAEDTGDAEARRTRAMQRRGGHGRYRGADRDSKGRPTRGRVRGKFNGRICKWRECNRGRKIEGERKRETERGREREREIEGAIVARISMQRKQDNR